MLAANGRLGGDIGESADSDNSGNMSDKIMKNSLECRKGLNIKTSSRSVRTYLKPAAFQADISKDYRTLFGGVKTTKKAEIKGKRWPE